jgi:hypothetical protein
MLARSLTSWMPYAMNESADATTRSRRSGFVYCSRYLTHSGNDLPGESALGPFSSRRLAACALVRPRDLVIAPTSAALKLCSSTSYFATSTLGAPAFAASGGGSDMANGRASSSQTAPQVARVSDGALILPCCDLSHAKIQKKGLEACGDVTACLDGRLAARQKHGMRL